MPGFGDNVRVRTTPETEALGIAGLTGQIYGETVPSLSGMPTVGPIPDDYAVNVMIEGHPEGLWMCPDLVEFVDHGPGITITLDGVPKKWTRSQTGEWLEESTEKQPARKWWEVWK